MFWSRAEDGGTRLTGERMRQADWREDALCVHGVLLSLA